MLRRLVLPLVLAGSVIFMLGAGASPASASNCTNVSSGATFHKAEPGGNIYFGTVVSSCTDVDMIEFYGGTTADVGWYDSTLSHQYGVVWIQGVQIYPSPQYLIIGLAGHATTGQSATYATDCWFIATQTHNLTTSFKYRIHSLAQNTWGVVHGPVYGPTTGVSGC